jgi:hypothetical protein
MINKCKYCNETDDNCMCLKCYMCGSRELKRILDDYECENCGHIKEGTK